MAPASRTLSSLIGGVSQQSAALRRPNQMEAQSNCYPSVVKGNMKRPPTEYVAKLSGTPASDAHVHTINRDPSERYKVVLLNGSLKVYDLNGVEKTVTFPDGTGYLTTATPKQSFRCFTIADYTFIANNLVEVAMDASLTAVRGYEAIVYVKQVELDYHYIVKVNGTSYDFQTHHETPPMAADIAEGLRVLLAAGGVTVTRDRSTLHITSSSALDVRAYGPNTDVDMRSFNKTIQNFTDLPTVAPEGYHVEVIGAQGNDLDNYHVKFVTRTGSGVDSGYWRETVGEGIKYKFDASTMPHVLIRNGDGTFTFKNATWAERTCGDDNTNVIPSFVGQTINDVTFHKGRLGFLADSNVILSESGQFFNFFRTTVTALLDTDPIDISVNSAVILRNAVEFDKNLLLTTDKQHYVLTGGDTLTPKSAAAPPATHFDTVPSTSPVATDKAVFFATKKGTYAGLREMLIDPVSGRPDPQDVTQHVPKYLSGEITKMAVSEEDGVLIVLTTGSTRKLYAYNFFWNGNQKLQSAWGEWDFGVTTTVLDMEFLNSTLYVVVSRTDGLHLLKLDVSVARVDSADADHLTNLDMRLSNAQCTAVYSAGVTTFTVPFTCSTAVTYQCVTRYTAPGDIAGIVMQGLTVNGTNHFTLPGDMTSLKFYFGEAYRQSFTLSEQFVQIKDASGGEVIIPDGLLKILFATFVFEKTGYFNAKVDFAHRPGAPSITEFQGRIAGDGGAIDRVVLSDDKLRVRIGGDSKRTTITVYNDSFLPANFQSANLECNETGRARTRP